MQTHSLTASTCSDACWYAKEDICRCSCCGTNHGILTRGGPRPSRERRISGTMYTLAGIVIGYGAAHREARETYGEYRPGDKGATIRVSPATETDFGRIEELAAFQPSPFHQSHPYLIWKIA